MKGCRWLSNIKWKNYYSFFMKTKKRINDKNVFAIDAKPRMKKKVIFLFFFKRRSHVNGSLSIEKKVKTNYFCLACETKFKSLFHCARLVWSYSFHSLQAKFKPSPIFKPFHVNKKMIFFRSSFKYLIEQENVQKKIQSYHKHLSSRDTKGWKSYLKPVRK